MLLKSIATNELLLPAESHQSVDVPSSEATEAISASLDMVRPNDHISNLKLPTATHIRQSSLLLFILSHSLYIG